ncbi:MAG TPA: succinate dehydrogenase [Casimicrobiaceae bacterium]|nr:succinate dehydrogenase [Casimicrobiaceae bacterium]
MSARGETYAWLTQRASAAVLALCVAVHLATLIFAVHAGLSASAILGRTRGSAAWMAFYALFVVAVSIHAPLGLRTIAAEWLSWRGRGADAACIAVGIVLLALGLRAVAAVTL